MYVTDTLSLSMVFLMIDHLTLLWFEHCLKLITSNYPSIKYFECLSCNGAIQTTICWYKMRIIILMIFQYHKHIVVKENEYNDSVPFRTFSPLTITISFYLSIILCWESCVTLYLTFKKSDRYKCYIRCYNVVFYVPNA